MAGGEDVAATSRGPLYGLIAIVVGVVAAVVFGLTVGGGTSQVASSGSPPAVAVRSELPSTAVSPSPSLASPEASALPSDAAQPSPSPSPLPTSGPTPTPTATPKATPKPTRTPNTNPTIVALAIPKTEDCTGGSAGTIHVSWKIANATGVTLSIDGPGIFDSYAGPSRAVDIPFACSHQQLSHTYTVMTTGGSGPAARITRTVTAARAQIRTFTIARPTCPSASASVGIAFAYEIVAATGVELRNDDGVYATYSGKKENSIVSFDCAKGEEQTFVLTTTGGFGPEATKEIVVRQR